MPRVLTREPVTYVWFGLVVATCVSWILGSDHGEGDHGFATTVVILVAFLKVRFVGLHFMALREAPATLRLIFEAYVGVVGLALVGLYLVG